MLRRLSSSPNALASDMARLLIPAQERLRALRDPVRMGEQPRPAFHPTDAYGASVMWDIAALGGDPADRHPEALLLCQTAASMMSRFVPYGLREMEVSARYSDGRTWDPAVLREVSHKAVSALSGLCEEMGPRSSSDFDEIAAWAGRLRAVCRDCRHRAMSAVVSGGTAGLVSESRPMPGKARTVRSVIGLERAHTLRPEWYRAVCLKPGPGPRKMLCVRAGGEQASVYVGTGRPQGVMLRPTGGLVSAVAACEDLLDRRVDGMVGTRRSGDVAADIAVVAGEGMERAAAVADRARELQEDAERCEWGVWGL